MKAGSVEKAERERVQKEQREQSESREKLKQRRKRRRWRVEYRPFWTQTPSGWSSSGLSGSTSCVESDGPGCRQQAGSGR